MKDNAIIITVFFIGCLVGWSGIAPEAIKENNPAIYILYALMFQVGISIGSDKNLKTMVKSLRLKMLLLPGSVLACSLLFLLEYRNMVQLYSIDLRQFIGGSIVFSALNVLLIVGERLLIHYAEWFWFRKLDLQHQAPDRLRLLIYGGGLNCRVFISTLYCAQKSGDREQIVGIIDDDPALQGLQVNGFRVFGSALEIERIYQKCPFVKIVIATNRDSDEGLSHLRQFCREKELPLVRLSISENPDA